MTFRYAVRRTQKQVDAERKVAAKVSAGPDASYRDLQRLAKARGIPGNQPASVLRELLK